MTSPLISCSSVERKRYPKLQSSEFKTMALKSTDIEDLRMARCWSIVEDVGLPGSRTINVDRRGVSSLPQRFIPLFIIFPYNLPASGCYSLLLYFFLFVSQPSLGLPTQSTNPSNVAHLAHIAHCVHLYQTQFLAFCVLSNSDFCISRSKDAFGVGVHYIDRLYFRPFTIIRFLSQPRDTSLISYLSHPLLFSSNVLSFINSDISHPLGAH
ncbi:hypothetical protein SCHPADRAFT_131068 [Schizopora paradoxa]|uniref:Uncharacterized protein n=1 Tax=Schizopora paradoxa TaxID=27342 RepID=A0A0H2S2N3_9AGAM|nr:hypothetical protein SCHPADRAFT_131068 [Schizopora paradoxa]